MGASGRARGAALLTLVAMSACAPTGEDPARVAQAFAEAIDSGDGTTACALLAPLVAEAVAEDAKAPCDVALGSGDVGDDLRDRGAGHAAAQVRVAGRQAQVRTETDTLFLARSGGSWVVTGAGCDPRPDRPYDCEVQG